MRASASGLRRPGDELELGDDAIVLCARARPDGTFSATVKIREACRARQQQLDPSALGMCCTPTTTSTTLPLVRKRVFVTSLFVGGNLGGLAGADGTCNSRAAAAGLSGTYKAWLADGTDSPSTRFTHATVPYIRVDDVVVANDWADLTDGTLAAAIAINENGDSLNTVVWTNVTTAGTIADPSFLMHCSGWTSSGSGFHGGYGNSMVAASGWTAGGDVACTVLAGIYCFEQ